MKVYIKNRKRKKGQFQFYMHQFVEAAIRRDIVCKNDIVFDIAFKAKATSASISRLRSSVFKRRRATTESAKTNVTIPVDGGNTLRKFAMLLYPWLNKKNKRKAIIITSTGATFFRNAFPFFFRYEVIPVLWDVWPSTWIKLYHDLRLFNCKTVFVTAKYMADKISRDLGIQAHWITEGIDLKDYNKGQDLVERPIEVYELGRQKKEYHAILDELHRLGIIKQYYRNTYAEDGALRQLAFPTADALLENLPKTKVLISFPLNDTHPQKAGSLETLTQRYWEAMLSRCLIVGRAPKELIDFIGYDPVVNIDWEKPAEQMKEILSDISSYQSLVDKNYAIALEKASWDNRIDEIIKILSAENYTF